jgi:hypothetical protein
MNKVDINEIVRRSLHEAKKTHGYIVEANETAAPPEASEAPDARKTAAFGMPKISLEAKTWGSGDTSSEAAAIIEDYMQNLRGTKTDSIEEVRSFLTRFNEALGMKVGSAGTPVYREIDPSNATLPAIVSSLVLRQAVVSMVRHNKGGTTGELWEGFVARILGKALPESNYIEDIEGVDSDGMLLTLKMLSKANADIKGSNLNLAYALSRPNVKGVRYLVGIKDEDNPFVVRFYSYDITKQNYFQFVIKGSKGAPKENPDADEILKVIADQKKKANLLPAKGMPVAGQTIKMDGEVIELPPELVAVVKQNKEGLETEQALFKFVFENLQDVTLLQKIKELEIQINSISDEQRASIINKLVSNEAIRVAVKKKGVEAVNLVDALLKQGNIEAILKGKNPEQFTGFFKSTMHTLLDKVLNTYTREDDLDERKKLSGVINALDDINLVFEQKKNEILKKVTSSSLAGFERHTASLTNAIGEFWQSFSEISGDLKVDPKAEATGQFKYAWSTVVNMPFLHIDRNFQPIYIDPRQLFVSTTKTVDLFREWAEPLYRNHAIMDTAIRKYFVKDDPSDMGKMEKSVEETKTHLNKMKVGGEFQKATQLGQTAQPVQENKKRFTRNYIDDILDDL